MSDTLIQLLQRLQNHSGSPASHLECVLELVKLQKKEPQIFNQYNPALYQILSILYQSDHYRDRNVKSLLNDQLAYKYTSQIKDPNLQALENDSILHLFLKTSLNENYHLEKVLKKGRSELLQCYISDKLNVIEYSKFLSSICAQCYNNEYIWTLHEADKKSLDQLRDYVIDHAVDSYNLTLLGCFQIVHTMDYTVSQKVELLSATNANIDEALNLIINNPLEENDLKESIQSIGELKDEITLSVRSQYESSPYPKWVHINLNSVRPPLFEYIKKQKSNFKSREIIEAVNKEILVAGCGTGRHPIMLANANPNANILAIDISKSSLAYAKRMSVKYDLQNIEFLHLDILNLPLLQRSFDHIDCVGVIHHMQDQARAWSVLSNLLRPNGTMNIAVYSKIARLPIIFLRNQVVKKDHLVTNDEIKIFREKLFTDSKYQNLFGPNTKISDLFSVSMVRDFIYHVHEYQYTIADIENFSKVNDLELLFVKAPASIQKKYFQQYPQEKEMDNYEKWKSIEKMYAGTYIMFQVYLQINKKNEKI